MNHKLTEDDIRFETEYGTWYISPERFDEEEYDNLPKQIIENQEKAEKYDKLERITGETDSVIELEEENKQLKEQIEELQAKISKVGGKI